METTFESSRDEALAPARVVHVDFEHRGAPRARPPAATDVGAVVPFPPHSIADHRSPAATEHRAHHPAGADRGSPRSPWVPPREEGDVAIAHSFAASRALPTGAARAWSARLVAATLEQSLRLLGPLSALVATHVAAEVAVGQAGLREAWPPDEAAAAIVLMVAADSGTFEPSAGRTRAALASALGTDARLLGHRAAAIRRSLGIPPGALDVGGLLAELDAGA
ncbi:MAG: hypothetical protein HYX34_05195 [Actinobacteria bacterium]|nr:hypothetical protein [Actinomycetota bacterium]